MSTSSGSPSEMPNLPRFSTRQLPDAACAEGLLTGRGVAPGAPAGQQALARLLEIAAGPAIDRELAGEAAAVAAFARVTSQPGSRRAGARPRTVPASRSRARLTLALAACVTALGGTAAVGALPAPIQEVAHVTFGAPAPHHSVPAPLPAGGSSRQPGNHGIQPKGQPGHQKARVKGQKALPDTAQGHQKAHGRKAHPHGQPGHQEIHPTGHPATHPDVSTATRSSGNKLARRRPPLPPGGRRPAADSCRRQRCQAPAGGAGFVVQAPVFVGPAGRAALRHAGA